MTNHPDLPYVVTRTQSPSWREGKGDPKQVYPMTVGEQVLVVMNNLGETDETWTESLRLYEKVTGLLGTLMVRAHLRWSDGTREQVDISAAAFDEAFELARSYGTDLMWWNNDGVVMDPSVADYIVEMAHFFDLTRHSTVTQ